MTVSQDIPQRYLADYSSRTFNPSFLTDKFRNIVIARKSTVLLDETLPIHETFSVLFPIVIIEFTLSLRSYQITVLCRFFFYLCHRQCTHLYSRRYHECTRVQMMFLNEQNVSKASGTINFLAHQGFKRRTFQQAGSLSFQKSTKRTY